MHKRIVVLAGHRRSLASIARVAALSEISRGGLSLVGVVSVFSFSIKRIGEWRRRFGAGIVRRVLSEVGVLGGGRMADEFGVYRDHLSSLGVAHRDLSLFCRELGVPHHCVQDVNSDHAVELVRQLRPNIGIYSGAGILRTPIIRSFADGVLNLHSGPLPAVRGMNAVEWSLYMGRQPEVTLHWIDAGIDTGAIVSSQTVPVRPEETLGMIRAHTVLAGNNLLSRDLPRIDRLESIPNPAAAGRQYYAMSEPLKRVVERWLVEGRTPVSSNKISQEARLQATQRAA